MPVKIGINPFFNGLTGQRANLSLNIFHPVACQKLLDPVGHGHPCGNKTFDVALPFAHRLHTFQSLRDFFLGQYGNTVAVTNNDITGSDDDTTDADLCAYSAGPIFLRRIGCQTPGIDRQTDLADAGHIAHSPVGDPPNDTDVLKHAGNKIAKNSRSGPIINYES